jgi:RHS repeat-associated protein
MRRYLGGALILALLSQSSGVALAGNLRSPRSDVDLAALVAPLRSAIAGSQVYALLTGSGDQYAAMHAPAPTIARPISTLDAAQLMGAEHPLHPRVRIGVRHKVIMPPLSALDRQHRRLDPLAMRRSQLTPAPAPGNLPGTLLEPLRSLVLAQGAHGAHSAPRGGAGIKPMASSAPTTGIEHWWSYEERSIPGIGKAMLNVGTGNLVVSAMDVDLPEQGIDLAFQRVYNSQSLHDYQGDDGGDDAIFGNRWTNNFDTNIVYNSTANTITVYDIDGAACTYTSNTDGTWQPCTGVYATLVPTDSTDCSYAWTKPNGTVYWFHSDQNGLGCGIQLAKKGHLQQILARNNTNNITFTYSYTSEGQAAEDVTEIDAEHSDGQELVMQFGEIPGTSINELSTITRPDGAVLQYSYDSSGNLLEVDKPGNNSASNVPSNPNTKIAVPQGDAPETYAYASGTSSLQEACGPRCTVAMWNNANNPTDGAALLFTVNGSLQLTSWQVNGVLNFSPQDGTASTLQPGYSTQFQNWYTANFVYGKGSACSNAGAGTTTMCDTDGHSTAWTTNSNYSVTQKQDWTGTKGLSIVTSQTWGTNNNLTSTTDANTNTTQYAYDTGGYNQGNMVEMQLPNSNDITNGPLSPLSFYSYDQYNNVTAFCDPVWTTNNGKSWVNAPGDNLCTGGNGQFASFTYVTGGTNEPFGCLTDTYTPNGYHRAITYSGGTGTCGVGLPATVKGDAITQYDNSTRTPTQDFGYDSYGNLNSYDKGQGNGTLLDSWTLAYNKDNILTQSTQNDASIPLSGSSFSCHYPDGSMLYTETPSQHDADGDPPCPTTATLLTGPSTPPQHATAYYDDLDGDQIEIVTHKGCSSVNPCNGATSTTSCNNSQASSPVGTTCKWYDGLDRLVETGEPYDTRTFSIGGQLVPYEFYNFRWLTRYIYDLSQSGGTASLVISDSTGATPGFPAYGNLYKTREYLPQPQGMIGALSHGQYQTGAWSDVRGTSFDGLDRAVSKYELAFGTTAVATNTYDCTGQADLLCSTVNAIGQTTTYTYDNIARVKQISFSGTQPQADQRTYSFDPDGRTASVKNSMGTLSYTYGPDGSETSVTEPSAQTQNVASLICYSYYPDQLRERLSIGMVGDSCGSIPYRAHPSNGGISQQNLFSYAYGSGGLLTTQVVNWGSLQETFGWSYYPSLREESETDPLSGEAVDIPPGGGGSSPLVAKQYSYDQYGRVNQLALPEGFEESTFVYDSDNELVQYNYGKANGTPRTLTLNTRGELLQDALGSNFLGYAQGPTYSANGAQVGNGDTTQGGIVQAPPTTLQYDVRSNMTTCIPDPNWAADSESSLVWWYQYDGAGRQISAYLNTSGACAKSGNSYTTTYDSENHVQQTTVSTNLNNPPGGTFATASVTWGPDARHRVDTLSGGGNSPLTETAHWDGDTMLFATGSSTQLYIGKLGVLDSSGDLYIADRDQTGAQIGTHASTPQYPPPVGGSTWFTGLSTGSARNIVAPKNGKDISLQVTTGSCNSFNPNFNPPAYQKCPSWGPVFPMIRSDGYTMAGGIVQGARTYDPTSGQWLTPDAYAGDVRDPMSQKPFMWNNNNPVEFADPSGYETGAVAVACSVSTCQGAGVTLPRNSDFYVKGSVSIGVFSGSAGHTARGTGYQNIVGGINANKDSLPSMRQLGAGLLTQSDALTRSGAKGVAGSTLGLSLTAGIISPAEGKTSRDVTNDQNTKSIQACFGGACIEGSISPSGATFGAGIGTPGLSFSVGPSRESQRQQPP